MASKPVALVQREALFFVAQEEREEEVAGKR